MSKEEVDAYLSALDEPKRSTLETLRHTILEIVPNAEQCISYTMPAFRVDGIVVAGFAAFKNHLSYFPHSGSVIPALGDDLGAYETSRGTLRFAPDEPLPRHVVAKLVTIRMAQAFRKS